MLFAQYAGGVIGNTAASEAVIRGSNPRLRALKTGHPSPGRCVRLRIGDIPDSFNGRTGDFESPYRGSNPRSGAMPYADYNVKMREYMARRYEERRAWIIEHLGGECIACGSKDKLEIDHKDPFAKTMNLNRRLAGLKWEKLVKEVELCQLLCEDCHREKSSGSEGDISKKKRASVAQPVRAAAS